MSLQISDYLQHIIGSESPECLTACFSVSQKLKKKEFLVKPGQNFPYLAFVKRGLFRVYFINDEGIEVTTWFSFPGMMITDMMAYYQQTSTSFYVTALEASEVLLANKSCLENAYAQSLPAAKFGRLYSERALVAVMQRMVDLQTKNAEERYRDLLSRPEFMQKIPLKYLASYLGITDSSLSRIRAKISH